MSKKKKPASFPEMVHSIRNDWGEINPVTRVIPDKRRKQELKPKHKNRNFED